MLKLSSEHANEHKQLSQFDSHKICIKTDKQEHFAKITIMHMTQAPILRATKQNRTEQHSTSMTNTPYRKSHCKLPKRSKRDSCHRSHRVAAKKRHRF